jgi:Tol biopolymer transport system component
MADFGSLYLSKAADKVTFDLWDPTLAQWDIYVASTDGSTLTQITNDLYEDSYPQLSWDGGRVVFTSRRDPGTGVTDMVVVRSATNPLAMEQVLPMPLGASAVWDPTFSPDGTKIALEAYGYNDVDGWFDGLVLMNADGSNAQLLTNPYASCECWDGFPAFTSDGRQIVFTGGTTTADASYVDVYIMNADGTGTPVQLTDGVGFNADPLLIQPRGLAEKIVFESNRDNLNATATTGYELYSMNLDGTGLTRLTINGLFDGFTQEWFQSQATAAEARAAVRNRHGHRLGAQSSERAIVHGFHF